MKSDEFKKIVKKDLVPLLREMGWRGTSFHYSKHIGNIIRLLTIQPSRSGGEFCVELGVHFDFICLKEEIDLLSKLKTWDVDTRIRLSPKDEINFWWKFPKDTIEKDQLFTELITLISTKGESYFKSFESWEEVVSTFTIESIEDGSVHSFFKSTSLRIVLLLAKIYQYLNKNERAIEFSKFGLSKIEGKKGIGLIPDFENIIQSCR